MCVCLWGVLARISCLFIFSCLFMCSLKLLNKLFTPFFCDERGGGRLHLRKKKARNLSSFFQGMREKKKTYTYIRGRKQARKEIKNGLGFLFFFFFGFIN